MVEWREGGRRGRVGVARTLRDLKKELKGHNPCFGATETRKRKRMRRVGRSELDTLVSELC